MVSRVAVAALSLASSLSGFENLPTDMMVNYGSPDAPVKIVEYMEIECHACHRFFKEEVPGIHRDLTTSGKASLSVHINPNTLLACQLILCLGDLGPQRSDQQRLAFEYVMENLERSSVGEIRSHLRKVLREQGIDARYISDRAEDVMQHSRISELVEYMKQGDSIPDVPTIAIDGNMLPGIPGAIEIYNKVGTINYQIQKGTA